eukprot:RCo019716
MEQDDELLVEASETPSASSLAGALRNLTFTIHSIFLRVQQEHRGEACCDAPSLPHTSDCFQFAGPTTTRSLRLSQMYRVALKEQASRLFSENDESAIVEGERQLWAILQSLWALVEALWMQQPSYVGPHFQKWASLQGSTTELAQLRKYEGPSYQCPSFWPVIKRMLCCGESSTALFFLQPYFEYMERTLDEDAGLAADVMEEEKAAFRNVRILLEGVPHLLRSDVGQFRQMFSRWQEDCQECFDCCS